MNILLKFIKDNHIKIISSILFLVGCFFIFLYLKPILLNFPIMGESLYIPFLFEESDFFTIFNTNTHSWFILSIIHVFINKYLPELLSLHPQVCMSKISSYLLFSFYIILLFSLGENLIKYTKNKYQEYKPFVGLFSILLFPFLISMLIYSNLMIVISFNDNHNISYLFLPVFAITLFSFIEYHYVNQIKLEKKEIIIYSFILFFMGISSEFFRFILVLSLPIIYILHKCIFKTKTDLKRDSILYAIIVFINSFICFIPSFYHHAIGSVYHKYTLSQFLEYLTIFMQQYICVILIKNIPLLITLLILLFLILLFVKDKDKNKRFILCITVSFFAYYVFYFIMIFTTNFYEADTVLSHLGLTFFAELFIFYWILSSFGYFFSFSSFKSKYKYIKFIISIVLICCSYFYLCKPFVSDIEQYFQKTKNLKINSYILEKSYLLSLNNKHKYYYNYCNECDYDNKEVYYLNNTYSKYNYYTEDNVKNVCEVNVEETICRQKLLDKLEEQFGYVFTERELKELDFESLYTFNFISKKVNQQKNN